MKLVVSDANIFLDMESGGLLEEMFRLSFDVAVPDILYLEELKDRHPELPGLGLQVMPLSGEAIGAAETLGQRYPKPGRNDLFALALALEQDCHLLTGDRDLRSAAEAEDLDVHGTLWLVEEIHNQLKVRIDAIETAYARMRHAGRRLPWDEVDQQLKRLKS